MKSKTSEPAARPAEAGPSLTVPLEAVGTAGMHTLQCALNLWDRMRRSQTAALAAGSATIGEAVRSASQAKDLPDLVAVQQRLVEALLAQAIRAQGDAVAAWTSLPSQLAESPAREPLAGDGSPPASPARPDGAWFGPDTWWMGAPARQPMAMDELVRQFTSWWSPPANEGQHAKAG